MYLLAFYQFQAFGHHSTFMYIAIIKKDHQLPQKLWIEDFVWTMFSNLVALLKDKLHLTKFGKKRLQFTEIQNEDKRRLSVVALNNSNIGKHIYGCNVLFSVPLLYTTYKFYVVLIVKEWPYEINRWNCQMFITQLPKIGFLFSKSNCILFTVTIFIFNNKLNIL